jgi:hypothetical protein
MAAGTGGWRNWISQISIVEIQRPIRFGDYGHGGLGEEAAALQRPFLVQLLQSAAHQSHYRSVIGEDADHVGTAFDNCAAKRTYRCDV